MSVDESGRRSYLPGAWFGIFGEAAAVLLPPTEKRRVAALWELLDDGADFDEVLDALIATGLRDLPGFLLVADTDDATRVVVRGAARATFETADGPVEVGAAGAGTWVERTVTGVTATVLEVPGADDDTDAPAPAEPMTVLSGLVRVSRVETPAPDRTTAAADDAPGSASPAGAAVAAAGAAGAAG
ncbi:hypothetical protein, partial [Nocardioides lentus]|uniref:hypothetical protein n=1 Tax=Nocardioides lentus TaxID=338077 RepID=UPI0031E030AF